MSDYLIFFFVYASILTLSMIISKKHYTYLGLRYKFYDLPYGRVYDVLIILVLIIIPIIIEVNSIDNYLILMSPCYLQLLIIAIAEIAHKIINRKKVVTHS